MALSLLSQHSTVLDFQQFFDTTSNQSHQQQLPYYSLQQFQQVEKSDNLQMEFNNPQTTVSHQQQQQHNHHHHNTHQQQQQSSSAQQQHNHKGNNHNPNNTTSNNNNNNNNNDKNTDNSLNSENINQNLGANRNYISGYHHQHIGTDYEQVINFVDSPPNSEESWTDEHSKESPGPQIIDVQTIFSNSGTRKRRMDWDSLDINQNDSSATVAQTRDITNKAIDHQHHHHQQQQPHLEKDRQKREKLTDRGSWTDDIGFDLNGEFNSNSYLNNEPFLSFSPTLTVPKQEPQSEQLLKPQKSPLNSVESIQLKIDKTIAQSPNEQGGEQQRTGKLEIIDNICDSPSTNNNHNTNRKTNENKHNNNNSTIGQNSANYSLNKCHTRNNAVIQQLTVIDATKIERAAAAAAAAAAVATADITTTTTTPATPLITGNCGNNNNNNNAAIYSDEHKFQYILAAATSIATKNNEETLTYLNQGQSYEIKLKKIGDLSLYRDKILKSVIKICFHERRLQFMEREQMQLWQASRPGERIIEVDVPLSYGLCHVTQQITPSGLNTVEVFWDPLKEVGVYIKVNCISTEFTAKKHGGEKGVPFRLQIETYIENSNAPISTQSAIASAGGVDCPSDNLTNNVPHSPNNNNNNTLTSINCNNSHNNNNNNNNNNSNNNNNIQQANNKQLVHAAACQIKVFKLKGADRKHKQDREKVLKRPQSEQEKFQPSYECTIMNDIPLDLMMPTNTCFSPEYLKIWPNSPVHVPKYDSILPYATNPSPTANSSPIAINSVTSTNSPTMKLMDTNIVSPPQSLATDMDDYMFNIMPDSTPAQVAQWLGTHRLTAYLTTFAHFSGSDIMRMSKDDLIQICGLADGIRMFNILRAKAITPRLTIYVSLDGNQSYQAIYLISHTAKELTQKLFKLPGFYELVANGGTNGIENGSPWGMHSKYSGSGTTIFHEVVYIAGPAGVHVTVTDDVLSNEIKDGSLYVLEVQNGKVVIKFANKNDN